jgi:hypothetical protein
MVEGLSIYKRGSILEVLLRPSDYAVADLKFAKHSSVGEGNLIGGRDAPE